MKHYKYIIKSITTKIHALGFNELLERILYKLLVMKAFSLKKVSRCLKVGPPFWIEVEVRVSGCYSLLF